MTEESMDVEVFSLAGNRLGRDTCRMDSSAGELRDRIQSWLKGGSRAEGTFEDSEITLLTGSTVLEVQQSMREYCTYTGEALQVTAVVGHGVNVVVRCGFEDILMGVSSATTAGRLKAQAADDLGFEADGATVCLVLASGSLHSLGDQELVLARPFVSGMRFKIVQDA
eukprot:TRINITY_DN79737_c0_g1_i1.p1 TRINITY_DN79737_c0_g1~~TRINITY_DN79737_c0_g1_i1.p1  ORF type:complete len:168 (-),score=33.81 TRINITY_DN79737_c0_g1_i1:72-575(-)